MLKDKSYYYAKKSLHYRHWCKENRQNRKIWNRKHRSATRTALATGEQENLPQYKASGGWLTW
jgi:hypothetical protein